MCKKYAWGGNWQIHGCANSFNVSSDAFWVLSLLKSCFCNPFRAAAQRCLTVSWITAAFLELTQIFCLWMSVNLFIITDLFYESSLPLIIVLSACLREKGEYSIFVILPLLRIGWQREKENNRPDLSLWPPCFLSMRHVYWLDSLKKQ